MSDTKKAKMSEEDFLGDIVLDWRALKSKRQKRRKFKDYQEQLLKEIPGAANRTNVAMHAVIDVTTSASENQSKGMEASTEIRNQALIHYIARLASSNDDDDEFDFSFVESLLENGADINTADKYGQTMFHEVARSWNVDVARFLLNRGANINQQDKYGRAPLHVAAAVDYTEMIEFLLTNNAEINITTFGELQTPIHFAAKNDACQALKLLINYGANVNCRDYQNRTPIQVAASMSRTKAARFFVELGTPTGVYDHNGEMTLSLLILKMPEIASMALDQFRSQDMINRKEYNFLNYIEGPRILEEDPRSNRARSPMEVAIQYEQYSIVMHPVMKRLINVKWEFFGKKGAQIDLIVNVVFAFVWTIIGITMPLQADQLYWPLRYMWWRLLFAIAAVSLTGLELYKQVSSFIYVNKAIRRWKTFREKSLWNDKRFCHPKWRDENEYLDKEIKDTREERYFTRQDSWIFLDWIALLLVISSIASHLSFLVIGSKLSRDVHVRIVSFVLIVLFIRLLKFTRPFEGPGPFVASIAPMLKDFLKWSLLFLLIFIPYASIFWMIFGPTNENYAPYLSDIPGLIFTVFSMAAFSNMAMVDDLVSIDQNMARILVGTLVAISTVIILNLLIAMLADTFTRMYENSLETATMQRAKAILYLEQKLPSTVWRQYCEHIMKECSPEVCSLSEDMCLGRRDKKRTKEKLLRSVEEINNVINDRFGSKVGTEISDMDRLLADVKNLKDALISRGPEHGATLTKPGSINLNIVLDQGNSPYTSLNGDGLKREELLSAKIECDAKQSFPKSKPKLMEICKQNIELHRKAESIPSTSSSGISSRLSDDKNEEASAVNHTIQRQLDAILNLIKEAIKNGKLNFTINGKALVMETTEKRESVEHLLVTDSESDRVQNIANCEDVATDTQSSGGIMNPACSPVLSQFETEADEARHSSLDLYMSDEVIVHTPIQSPNLVMVDQAAINSEHLDARYERSRSFLSTSSTDGNTTCDENMFSSSQTSVVSIPNNTDQILSPNEEASKTRIKPNQPKKSHRRLKPPKTSFFCSSGSSHGGSSESVFSNHENKTKTQKEITSNHSDLCEDGFSTSSQSTDITDQSYDEDSQVSGVDHYASTDVSVPSYNTSPEKDSLIPKPNVVRGPHVRWADTASEPGSTPFLNILEISASDNFSGEIVRLESDTTSGDDHEVQSGSERNTGEQTDV